jgi:hypothetical protein
MHFTQNATMILLGGIFDRFSMPPGYYLALPALTILAAGVIVLSAGPKNLSPRPARGAKSRAHL